jgi:hypothetical protein
VSELFVFVPRFWICKCFPLSSLVNVREISETMTSMAREMEKVQHLLISY